MVPKLLNVLLLNVFLLTSVLPPSLAANVVPALPAIGAAGSRTPFQPLLLQGLRVDPGTPLGFEMVLDMGDSGLRPGSGEDAKIAVETERMARYFLASLAVPEEEQWVNLSPVERGRIIPELLGRTGLGRDMLAQDYLLKQVSAGMMNPTSAVGQRFWTRLYAAARTQGVDIEGAANTFNKVWVSGDRADVYVQDNTAFVVDSRLKVQLDNDRQAAAALDS